MMNFTASDALASSHKFEMPALSPKRLSLLHATGHTHPVVSPPPAPPSSPASIPHAESSPHAFVPPIRRIGKKQRRLNDLGQRNANFVGKVLTAKRPYKKKSYCRLVNTFDAPYDNTRVNDSTNVNAPSANSGYPWVADDYPPGAVFSQSPRHPKVPLGTPMWIKYGEEHYPEEVTPTDYVWIENDGTVCCYITNFLLYNKKGERLLPIEALDNEKEGGIVLYGKLVHVALIHPPEMIRANGHPCAPVYARVVSKKKKTKQSSKAAALMEKATGLEKRKRLLPADGAFIPAYLKGEEEQESTRVRSTVASNEPRVPKSLRTFPIRVDLVDWCFDYGYESTNVPYIWLISQNDVYYRLEKPAGRYISLFAPTKLKFEVCCRVIKTLQCFPQQPFDALVDNLTLAERLKGTERSSGSFEAVFGGSEGVSLPNSEVDDSAMVLDARPPPITEPNGFNGSPEGGNGSPEGFNGSPEGGNGSPEGGNGSPLPVMPPEEVSRLSNATLATLANLYNKKNKNFCIPSLSDVGGTGVHPVKNGKPVLLFSPWGAPFPVEGCTEEILIQLYPFVEMQVQNFLTGFHYANLLHTPFMLELKERAMKRRALGISESPELAYYDGEPMVSSEPSLLSASALKRSKRLQKGERKLKKMRLQRDAKSEDMYETDGAFYSASHLPDTMVASFVHTREKYKRKKHGRLGLVGRGGTRLSSRAVKRALAEEWGEAVLEGEAQERAMTSEPFAKEEEEEEEEEEESYSPPPICDEIFLEPTDRKYFRHPLPLDSFYSYRHSEILEIWDFIRAYKELTHLPVYPLCVVENVLLQVPHRAAAVCWRTLPPLPVYTFRVLDRTPLPVDDSTSKTPLPVGDSTSGTPLPVDDSTSKTPLPVDDSTSKTPLPLSAVVEGDKMAPEEVSLEGITRDAPRGADHRGGEKEEDQRHLETQKEAIWAFPGFVLDTLHRSFIRLVWATLQLLDREKWVGRGEVEVLEGAAAVTGMSYLEEGFEGVSTLAWLGVASDACTMREWKRQLRVVLEAVGGTSFLTLEKILLNTAMESEPEKVSFLGSSKLEAKGVKRHLDAVGQSPMDDAPNKWDEEAVMVPLSMLQTAQLSVRLVDEVTWYVLLKRLLFDCLYTLKQRVLVPQQADAAVKRGRSQGIVALVGDIQSEAACTPVTEVMGERSAFEGTPLVVATGSLNTREAHGATAADSVWDTPEGLMRMEGPPSRAATMSDVCTHVEESDAVVCRFENRDNTQFQGRSTGAADKDALDTLEMRLSTNPRSVALESTCGVYGSANESLDPCVEWTHRRLCEGTTIGHKKPPPEARNALKPPKNYVIEEAASTDVEWVPDATKALTKGIHETDSEALVDVFLTLRLGGYGALSVANRLLLMKWLIGTIAEGPIGKSFMDAKMEAFYAARTNIVKLKSYSKDAYHLSIPPTAAMGQSQSSVSALGEAIEPMGEFRKSDASVAEDVASTSGEAVESTVPNDVDEVKVSLGHEAMDTSEAVAPGHSLTVLAAAAEEPFEGLPSSDKRHKRKPGGKGTGRVSNQILAELANRFPVRCEYIGEDRFLNRYMYFGNALGCPRVFVECLLAKDRTGQPSWLEADTGLPIKMDGSGNDDGATTVGFSATATTATATTATATTATATTATTTTATTTTATTTTATATTATTTTATATTATATTATATTALEGKDVQRYSVNSVGAQSLGLEANSVSGNAAQMTREDIQSSVVERKTRDVALLTTSSPSLEIPNTNRGGAELAEQALVGSSISNIGERSSISNIVERSSISRVLIESEGMSKEQTVSWLVKEEEAVDSSMHGSIERPRKVARYDMKGKDLGLSTQEKQTQIQLDAAIKQMDVVLTVSQDSGVPRVNGKVKDLPSLNVSEKKRPLIPLIPKSKHSKLQQQVHLKQSVATGSQSKGNQPLSQQSGRRKYKKRMLLKKSVMKQNASTCLGTRIKKKKLGTLKAVCRHNGQNIGIVRPPIAFSSLNEYMEYLEWASTHTVYGYLEGVDHIQKLIDALSAYGVRESGLMERLKEVKEMYSSHQGPWNSTTECISPSILSQQSWNLCRFIAKVAEQLLDKLWGTLWTKEKERAFYKELTRIMEDSAYWKDSAPCRRRCVREVGFLILELEDLVATSNMVMCSKWLGSSRWQWWREVTWLISLSALDVDLLTVGSSRSTDNAVFVGTSGTTESAGTLSEPLNVKEEAVEQKVRSINEFTIKKENKEVPGAVGEDKAVPLENSPDLVSILGLYFNLWRYYGLDSTKVRDLTTTVEREAFLTLIEPNYRAIVPDKGETLIYFKEGHENMIEATKDYSVAIGHKIPPHLSYVEEILVEDIWYHPGDITPIENAGELKLTHEFVDDPVKLGLLPLDTIANEKEDGLSSKNANLSAARKEDGMTLPASILPSSTLSQDAASTETAKRSGTQITIPYCRLWCRIVTSPGTTGGVGSNYKSLHDGKGGQSTSTDISKTRASSRIRGNTAPSTTTSSIDGQKSTTKNLKDCLSKSDLDGDKDNRYAMLCLPLKNGIPEYFVRKDKFMAALNAGWKSGMRFKMYFQTEDDHGGARFTGTVRKVDYDAVNLWECVVVEWDMNRKSNKKNLESVNIWELEPIKESKCTSGRSSKSKGAAAATTSTNCE